MMRLFESFNDLVNQSSSFKNLELIAKHILRLTKNEQAVLRKNWRVQRDYIRFISLMCKHNFLGEDACEAFVKLT